MVQLSREKFLNYLRGTLTPEQLLYFAYLDSKPTSNLSISEFLYHLQMINFNKGGLNELISSVVEYYTSYFTVYKLVNNSNQIIKVF